MSAKLWIAGAACLLGACGDNIGELAYTWNDDAILCSTPVDDYQEEPNWGRIDKEMREAEHYKWAALYHAHIPGETVKRETLEKLFDMADSHGLEYDTFRELSPDATPHAAIAFAFDDSAVDNWAMVRDVLLEHDAKITLFVTRWFELSDEQKQQIAEFAAEGDDVEPHTVHHLNAGDYVNEHGMNAYIHDEVLPSFTALTDAGYPTPVSFAYPFGVHSPEIDKAVLESTGVRTVRTTPGECDYR